MHDFAPVRTPCSPTLGHSEIMYAQPHKHIQTSVEISSRSLCLP